MQLVYVATRDGNDAGPLHKGAKTVAIYREKTADALKFEREQLGCEKPDPKERVVDFSYESDELAQMIVDAWTDAGYRDRLLQKKNAVSLLAERGIYLSKAHIITEDDYHRGHVCDDPDEIIFVLPNPNRADLARKPLLETAKLLMAITPNGI